MRSERKEKRYIRMLLEYLDKEKFENMPVCSQGFHEDEYGDLVDSFEQVEMTRAIGDKELKAMKEVRENFMLKYMGFDSIRKHLADCVMNTRGIREKCYAYECAHRYKNLKELVEEETYGGEKENTVHSRSYGRRRFYLYR